MIPVKKPPNRYPATHRQKTFLTTYSNPACTDELKATWVLSNAVLVSPRIDMRMLERAARKLWARHDSLRIQLNAEADDWVATILPVKGKAIEEIDLGDLDDASLQAALRKIAALPMPLIGGPLAEMKVLHCGARGDVLVTRVHHAVVDGHGQALLTEELLGFMLGILPATKAVGHAEFLAQHQRAGAKQAARNEAYWRKIYRSAPMPPNIGRRAKGLPPIAPGSLPRSALLRVQVTGDSLAGLEQRQTVANSSVTIAIFAGFLDALCRIHGIDHLLFQSALSRTDPAIQTYCGDRVYDTVMHFRHKPGCSIDAQIEQLRKTTLDALAHLPAHGAETLGPLRVKLAAGGADLNQFRCYPTEASNYYSRSSLKADAEAPPGSTKIVGPFAMTPIDINPPRPAFCELQVEPPILAVPDQFLLRYDTEAFTREEVETVARELCASLDLEINAMHHEDI